MDLLKQYRKKSFVVITLLALLLAAASGAGLNWGINWCVSTYASPAGQAVLAGLIPVGMEYLLLARAHLYPLVFPVLAGGILLLAWIFWAVLGAAVAPVFKTDALTEKEPSPKRQPGKKDFLDHKLEQERKRRLFLHTLSVLQREGRLLDFFDEDLGRYEDEQIGAAVRSIQEDCKKAVKKYINPLPVMDMEEGSTVTIDPGFDMDAVALVGNVAGEPPFNGVLRHRGWKAGKKEIPKLSDIQDAGIIVPAEVEI